MRVLLILLVLAIGGCAGSGGTWPSLARRPIEGPAAGASRPPVIATAIAPAIALAPPLPPAISDARARVATIDRDLADLASRVATQTAASATAAAAARGQTEGDAWAKAQLEATRLERLGTQAGDLRDRLDTIAGTLAETAAAGVDVSAILQTTGRAIERARKLEAQAGLALTDTSRTPR